MNLLKITKLSNYTSRMLLYGPDEQEDAVYVGVHETTKTDRAFPNPLTVDSMYLAKSYVLKEI